MAIFRIYRDGVKEIIVQDSSAFTFVPDGKTKSYSVTRVVYYHEHWMPPSLLNIGGKKYIIPFSKRTNSSTWTEVHPETTLADVVWKKPEVKQPIKETKTFPSKSDPSVTYKSTRTIYPSGEIKHYCNCPGKWRAKDGMCKHLKSFA
tara:strand:- start:27 stop:467 length:441 start_codon:yes stop_codon:yes gene_type:complete